MLTPRPEIEALEMGRGGSNGHSWKFQMCGKKCGIGLMLGFYALGKVRERPLQEEYDY